MEGVETDLAAVQSAPEQLALRYDIARDRLPEPLRNAVVELTRDAQTEAYLSRAVEQRSGPVRSWLHAALRRFLSDFDVNGLLRMYPMHLLSTAQWHTLLGHEPIARCLDVGAGSGDVTLQLAPLCVRMEASETSQVMARRLRARGIACLERDLSETREQLGPFDLITCLNVLDRCARPLTLLQTLRGYLSPKGRLVVALALPYSPFYYRGASTLAPRERLACVSEHWEEAVLTLYVRHLEPLGLALEALSRAPYLSGGDAHQALYTLDAALLVCRAR